MLPSCVLRTAKKGGIISASEMKGETAADKTTDKTRDYPASQVHFLEVDAREFILVGTAHVSRESAELVRRVIEQEKPDRVCVELDAQRYQALTQKQRWEALDIKEVIRKKQLSTLMVNLLLSAYQKKLGLKLGVLPGTELLEATRAAEESGIPVSLCDRDVRVTLRRAWRSTPFWKKTLLLSAILASVFDDKEVTEEQIEHMLEGDVLSELMKELGEAMPSLKKVLIDERDLFLTHKMRDSEGERVVVVVGAGHVEGIKKALAERQTVDLAAINTIPPASPVWKWIGWGVPIAILGSIAYIGWSKGPAAAGDNALYWILANGIPSAIGALLALAHPLTIVAAFVAAPITSLTPVIGAAYVTAFVQAWVRPPVVKEFQTVGEDVSHLRKWWQNKLLRVFLAFLLPGIGSMLGSVVGGIEIFSNLFE
ncbi:MAG: TraB/GumN family protein [Acidobacteriota bacterium]|nr:MAG: TraB/GumN family protein [Acidobacteriota bacterium]